MKIATQNLILIPPIFVLLAVLASVLLFFGETAQTRWGLDEEVQGLALVLSEFVDASTVERLAGGTLSDEGLAAFRAPLDRILGFGQATRIRLFDVRSTPPRLVLDVGDATGRSTGLSDHNLARVASGLVVIQPPDRSTDTLEAFGPIATGGRVHAMVAVQTRLDPLRNQEAATVRRIAIIAVALLVVGGLVSLSISRFIATEIKRLTTAVRAFASGHYNVTLAASAIEEMAIVGSTFDIMGSVLQETTGRSRRAMVELEQFGIDSAIEAFYAERFAGAVAEDCGSYRIAIDRLGPPAQEDFWFVRTVGDDAYACLGRTNDVRSLAALVSSSALVALLTETLAGGASARDALAQAAALFRIHCCVLLRWRDQGSVEVTRLQPDHSITASSFDLALGPTAVVTTLDSAADHRVVRYCGTHDFVSPEACVSELKQFFREGVAGGVLAVQRRGPSAATPVNVGQWRVAHQTPGAPQ